MKAGLMFPFFKLHYSIYLLLHKRKCCDPTSVKACITFYASKAPDPSGACQELKIYVGADWELEIY